MCANYSQLFYHNRNILVHASGNLIQCIYMFNVHCTQQQEISVYSILHNNYCMYIIQCTSLSLFPSLPPLLLLSYQSYLFSLTHFHSLTHSYRNNQSIFCWSRIHHYYPSPCPSIHPCNHHHLGCVHLWHLPLPLQEQGKPTGTKTAANILSRSRHCIAPLYTSGSLTDAV